MRSAAELLPNATHVTICTPDFYGRLLGKKRPAADLPQLLETGMAMPDFHLICNVEGRPLGGFEVAGLHTGLRNGILKPDAQAAFVSPVEADVVLVLSDALAADGTSIEQAPRAVLGKQLDRLAKHGITARIASELEFYLIKQDYSRAHDLGYKNLEPYYHRAGDNEVMVASLAAPFCDQIETALAACGIVVDQIQGEGGAGQFEINVAPADPMRSADSHIVFKHVVKALGHQAGHAVTFMAKPFEREAGSGGHVHLSLRSGDSANALGSDGSLSPFGHAFVAGLLAFAPEFGLLHAPFANSYKRLMPGEMTPLRTSWAWDNRTAMVRLLNGNDGVRLEFRLPGADVNPYHSYAAIIAAGIAGVEMDLSLPAEKKGDADAVGAEAMPLDLTEAAARCLQSKVASDLLGHAVHTHVLQHAAHELAATRRGVTDWEVARGFENA